MKKHVVIGEDKNGAFITTNTPRTAREAMSIARNLNKVSKQRLRKPSIIYYGFTIVKEPTKKDYGTKDE